MARKEEKSVKPKLRQISDKELERILTEHKKWLESGGQDGVRADLNCCDLRGKQLNDAELKNAVLIWVKLDSANLNEANLQGATLDFAELIYANLWKAKLQKSHLMQAKLQHANLTEAKLQGANLTGACLKRAGLKDANLKRAILLGANLCGADLRGADMQDTNVTRVKYDYNIRCQGIRAADCFGSPMFKRTAQDQEWLEEFQATRTTRWQKVWAWLWRETSDYGRSMGRWALISFLLALIFGICFFLFGAEHFHVRSPLPEPPSLRGLVSMIYYSVVTFTTLGFGDISPKTPLASILVTIEVVLGYIMLGGLISILAAKLARRS